MPRIQDSVPQTPYCLACGGETLAKWAEARDVEYYSSADTSTYHQCQACRSLSIFPVPEDRLAEIYPPSYYSFTKDALSLATKVKLALDRRLFASLFRRIDRTGAKAAFSALDVGGGTGWLLDQAKQAEPRLTNTVVVDIDAGAKAAALAAGHNYFHGRIEDFSSDQKFDLVLMLNVIEHVKDPVTMLAKARDLLAPGGLILVKTPNYDSLDARLFRHRNWGGYHCPRHWVLFHPESYRSAAVRAGLTVVELKLTQGAPFWAVSVLHMMKTRGWTEISHQRPAVCHAIYPLLVLGFAAFDFTRLPFMSTSQMFVVLRGF